MLRVARGSPLRGFYPSYFLSLGVLSPLGFPTTAIETPIGVVVATGRGLSSFLLF